MESGIRTGSGFQAQGAVEWKTFNRNPDTTDWFQLEGSDSRNFAWKRIGNVTTVAADENVPGTGRAEPHISHSFSPPHPHLLSIFICVLFRFALRLESERVVRIRA